MMGIMSMEGGDSRVTLEVEVGVRLMRDQRLAVADHNWVGGMGA
jgi:hypothetical protein